MTGTAPAVPDVPGPPLPPPAHSAPLPRALELPCGVRFVGGVPYADLPGARPLELDLWLPATRGPAPVVVFLHGGGWRLGSRRSAGPAFAGAAVTPFERIAGAGVAVAAVDYRLSGEAHWPAQLHDAKAAVRWLRARATEIGLDPDRIAAWGESAGGQLAELLGLTADETGAEGAVGLTGPSSGVRVVVAWYAPSDIAAVATDTGQDPADPTTREALLLGAPAAAVPELAAAASPLAHVTALAPPFLLLHGRSDRLIPAAQSERLHRALTDAGGDSALHLYDGADHMWRGAPAAAADAVERTLAFLHLHLHPTPGAPS